MQLMAEMQAWYPHQTLPEGTPDLWLAAWEEIALRCGMAMFRDGLLRAMRASRFIPDPSDVAAECAELKRTERNRAETALLLKKEYLEREAILADWRDLRQRDEHAYQAEAPGWVKVALAAEPVERVA